MSALQAGVSGCEVTSQLNMMAAITAIMSFKEHRWRWLTHFRDYSTGDSFTFVTLQFGDCERPK